MIEKGELKVNVRPRIRRETKATARIDGRRGFGQVTGTEAMKLAIKKARSLGVGIVTSYNTNHVGRLADFSILAADQDMIGIFAAKSAPPMVEPWGGVSRVLGTSPFSFAIPSGKSRPIVSDFATSIASQGKIRVALMRGQRLPRGWILDSKGRPSVNPADYYDGGAILPFGEYKGYALNLMVEALGGAMGGGGVAGDFVGWDGIFAQAIRPDYFVPKSEFKGNIDKLIKTIKRSRTRGKSGQILLPGDPEFYESERRMRDGIFIEEATWKSVVAVASRLRVQEP
jgi:uncharacterized oxidoreductase